MGLCLYIVESTNLEELRDQKKVRVKACGGNTKKEEWRKKEHSIKYGLGQNYTGHFVVNYDHLFLGIIGVWQGLKMDEFKKLSVN